MASQHHVSFSPVWLTALLATASLVGCGGGGSKDNASSALSTGNTSDLDARVSYEWAFEDLTGPVSHQYFPRKDGVAVTQGMITTCADNAVNCSVTQEVGKTGKGLRFYPNVSSSFAWMTGYSAASMCSSDVLQLDPFGRLDYRMTVAMWIKPDQIEAGKTYHLFGTGDPIFSSMKTAAFHLRVVDGKVRMSLYPNEFSSEPDLKIESTSTLSVSAGGDNWHHVAFTYDNLKSTLYVDGKLEKTGDRLPKNNRIKEACRPYYLGGMSAVTSINGAPVEASSYIFPGVIDQLIFSNRTYSADEILKLAGGVPVK